ncbi:hypothetical protein K2224_25255 [Streptomyces sp. BHT-5-2]|nr:hypothetical protein [Streptomyces sp. BHT-5-2]QZL07132.1 hypothetical protein K2224_25255 [Streptomyces sp. BHT-5-2]
MMPKSQNRKSGKQDRAAERRSEQHRSQSPESAAERTQDLKPRSRKAD